LFVINLKVLQSRKYTQSFLAVGHPEIALRLTTIALAEALCFVKLINTKK